MQAIQNEVEKRLWAAADELRANSRLKSSEYSVPVLGLIFLRYADHRFSEAEKELEGKATGRRSVGKTDYQAQGVMYLPKEARFSTLLNLPEGADIGRAINDAMRAIERENEELKDVLPKTYHRFEGRTLVELLRIFNSIRVSSSAVKVVFKNSLIESGISLACTSCNHVTILGPWRTSTLIFGSLRSRTTSATFFI